MKQIRVLIADHQYLIREGLKWSLKDKEDVVIVGETTHLEELKTLVPLELPDILMLEINLCDEPMRELMEELKQYHKTLKILVISDCDCELPIIMSIRAGVAGFVRKTISKEELYTAIRSVSKGQQYFSPDITSLLAQAYVADENNDAGFSDRELEILRYICKGRSNEQIGDLLFISEKTVATHKRNIMRKAGVKKTSDLIVWALDRKVVVNS